MRRKFLWKPSNCREESYRISSSRNRLKRHIRELYPEDKILFEEENQNFIYVTNENEDELGTISWVEELGLKLKQNRILKMILFKL